MAFRTPRGLNKWSFPYMAAFENSQTPSYPIKPALFLPVYAVDKNRNDPIVLPPGTFVGTLNARDHSALDSTFTDGGYIAPACGVAYVLTYGANDLEDAIDDNTGTPDIDVNASTIVAAAGDSTATLIVKPLGVIGKPMYAGWLKDRWDNYNPDLFQGWISKDIIIRIPCITANEKLIEAGDLVKLDDTASPKWNPGDLTATAGRLMAFDGGSYANDHEYVVGRCTRKIHLGRQATPSAGTTLDSAIGASAPRTHGLDTTAAYLWPTETNFKVQSKAEGVPGHKLSATSETLGRPAELLYARSDSNGDFWAIDVKIEI